MRKSFLLISIVAFIIMLINVVSCKHEPIPPVIPPNINSNNGNGNGNGNSGICFSDQILPLIQTYCAYTGCHDGNGEAMNLTTYNNIMNLVQAGNANGSTLYNVIIGGGEEPMPPNNKPQLSTSQVLLIYTWIQQGALNTACACDSTITTFSGAVWPTIQNHCLGCHSGSNPAGNPALDLSSYNNIVSAVNSQNLYGRIAGTIGAIMPPGNKLSNCNITQIHQWILGGMLNN